ncbi:hypothetical protein J4429_01235 [Candidatus Pacearchaeota archaeon]|nr:hypothetical protein [Candidatus Pacearchaeota archaeon]
MREINNSFNENKVIGNSAENIVEYMINSMPDWECIKFGVENHVEDLKKTVRERINSVTRKIKSMPDFVAFNTKTGETFFIEAKYRKFINKQVSGRSEYQFDFLNEYLKYWKETKLIVVHPYIPYFFVINLKDVERNMLRKEQTGLNSWRYF